jgi:beta-lactamase regulating signal transducer with metallopeptidase domain
MMSALEALLAAAVTDRSAGLLMDVTLKATLLLVAAMLVSLAMRKTSAAARHRLWALIMLSLLVMPLLPSMIPTVWSVTVPRQVATLMSFQTAAEPRTQESVVPYFPATNELSDRSLDGAPIERLQDSENVPDSETLVIAEVSANEISASTEPTGAANPWDFARKFVPLVWLCGAALCLADIAIGMWRVLRFRASSCLMDDHDWNIVAAETKRRLGLTQSVPLREHPEQVVPMTLGVLRPIVILPRQAREWPEQLKRIVLLHELAHVKRRDVAIQWLGRLSCTLYWFHPLVWYGLRQLRTERELACDDLVIHCGERATEYAEALVSVAKSFQTQRGLTCSVAMTRHGKLEGRMRSLFDKDIVRSHKPLSRNVAIVMLVVSVLAVSAISAMQLAVDPSESDKKTVAFRPDEKTKTQEPVQSNTAGWLLPETIEDGINAVVGEAFSPALEGVFGESRQYRAAGPLERTVTVIDKAGQPVEGANIIPWGFGTSNGTGWSWIPIWPKEFVTNAEGIATIFVSEELTAVLPESSGDFTFISFRVEHPDFAPEVQQDGIENTNQTVILSKGVTVVAKALDSATGRQLESDLYAVSSGYRTPAWKMDGSLLRSTPFNAAAPATGRYFRVVYAPDDAPEPRTMFSDVVDASGLDVDDHMAKPDIELYPGVELSGMLSENVERPVKAGGRVIAVIISGSDHSSCSWHDVAPITEEGTFRFAVLPRNSHVELIALCDGWVSQCVPETAVKYDQEHGTRFAAMGYGGSVSSTPFRLKEDAANVILNMVETGICRIKVVDEQEQPIDLATITLMPNHQTREGSTFLGAGGRSIDALRRPGSVPTDVNFEVENTYVRVTSPQGIAVISNLPATSHMVAVNIPGYTHIPDPRYAMMEAFPMESVDIKAGELNQKILRMRKGENELSMQSVSLLKADGMWPVTLQIVDDNGAPLSDARIHLVSQNIMTFGQQQPWPADWPRDIEKPRTGNMAIRVPRPDDINAEGFAKSSIWIDIEADGCLPLKNHEVSLSQQLPIRLQAVHRKPE